MQATLTLNKTANETKHFSVLSFHCRNEGFNSDPTISLTVLSHEFILPQRFMWQAAHLQLQANNQQRYWHGCIAAVSFIGKQAQQYRYQLLMASPWHWLTRQVKNKVYVNERISGLIKKIMADYPDLMHRLQWHIPDESIIIDYAAQYQETDYVFLDRWLTRLGIVTTIEQTRDNFYLHFFKAHPQKPTKSLTFMPNNQMLEQTARVYQQQHYDLLLSQACTLTEYHETEDLTVTAHSRSKQMASGNLLLYGLRYQNRQQGQQLARLLIEQLDWQRHLVHLSSNYIDLAVGDIVKIQQQALWRVLLIEHSYEANSYHNHVLLSAANTPYRKPCCYTQLNRLQRDTVFKPCADADLFGGADIINSHRQARSGLLTATIDAARHTVVLDQQGYYRVKMDFADNHYPLGANSSALPLLQATTHMHWPLRGQTAVAIGHLNGDLDRPFIVGAIADSATPGPVTQLNQQQYIWRSWRGAELLLDDSDGAKLQLQTRGQAQQLCFNQQSGHSDLSVKANSGSIQLTAAVALDATCAATYQVHSCRIKHASYYDSELISHHGQLIYQADRRFQAFAGQTLQMASQHYLIAESADAIELKAQTNIHLQTEQGALQLSATHGTVLIQAGSAISLASTQGNISLSNGKASCQLLADGQIRLSAENLYFSADSINFAENTRLNSV